MADPLEGFDPAVFRSVITSTMTMGLPQALEERPTFFFRSVVVYPLGTLLDTEGSPLDPRIAPTITSPDPVQVPCAVEFKADNNNEESLVGTFRQTAAVLTLLDTHYALVKDAIEVNIAGNRYIISYSNILGLSTVTVYQLYCFPKQGDDL